MNHLSLTPPDAATTAALMAAPWVAMDTEFDGPKCLDHPHKKPGKKNRAMPDQLQARLVGFSLWYPGCPWEEGVYCPVVLDPNGPNVMWVWLLRFLTNYSGQLWFHNALADVTVLCNPTNQLPFPQRVCDTMVLAWCLGKRRPGTTGGLSLNALIQHDLGVAEGKSFHEEFQGRSSSEVEPEVMAPYAAKDAWYTGRLVERYVTELTDERLKRHVFEVEMPLIRTVHQMYVEGVRVDSDTLNAEVSRLEGQCEVIAREFTELTRTFVKVPVKVKKPTGEMFKNGKPKMKTVEVMQEQCVGARVSSNDQVRRWLYHELKWWPTEGTPLTDSKELSTAAAVIKGFTHLEDPLARKAAELRLQYSKLSKLNGTYVKPLPTYGEKHGDGRVHANMHQTGTDTSRFSSSSPNLQNLPRPDEDYYGLTLPNIRAAIIPRGGYSLLGADYGQLELRILAHLSQDEGLCRVFHEGGDPHQATRDQVKRDYGLDITRTQAKTTIFGVMYGQGPGGLSSSLGISKDDALKFINGVYRAYPGVKQYKARAIKYARTHNAIPTLGGFVRYLDYPDGGCPKDGSRAFKTKFCRGCDWCRKASAADRQAVNGPVQGSAGVIMKKAMVALEKRWRGTDNRILMQVHDELLCEVPRGQEEQAATELQGCMENAMQLRVPLVAEAKWGNTWAELK